MSLLKRLKMITERMTMMMLNPIYLRILHILMKNLMKMTMI